MSLLPSFTSGTLFGTALLCSGVYLPSVITSQLALDNFHMMQTFLVASAASAVVVQAAQRSGFAPCPAREPAAAYGRVLGGAFSPYDANVLGGLLIGTGMALTGSCPGTVFVQAAVGAPSSVAIGLGGILGGVLFTGLNEWRRRRQSKRLSGESTESEGKSRLSTKTQDAVQQSTSPSPPTATTAPTLATTLKLSPSTAFLLYESFLTAAILGSEVLPPASPEQQHWLHPLLGGLLIGMAQAGSVLLTRKTVGISTAFHDLGRRIWRLVSGGKMYADAASLTPSLAFAGGVGLGSAAVARSGYLPGVAGVGVAHGADVSFARGVLGGAVLLVGSGLAGGCPSGHGISGMATLGIASFASVAGMFAGGIAVQLGLLGH